MIIHSRQVRLLLAAALIAGVILLARLLPKTNTIRGTVTASGTPVSGALVRVQGSNTLTITEPDGSFTLSVSSSDHITASAPGYYIAVGQPDASGSLALTLKPHPTLDDADYHFVSPLLESGSQSACARCHANHSDAADVSLPFEEWLADAHAQSVENPRFLSLYNGTTLDGEQGTATTYRFDAELSIEVPVAPSLGQDSAGAGYRLDFPDQTGACANCHAPLLALSDPAAADVNTAEAGITCDFCHKVFGVRLGADGKPLPQLPGVLSLQMLRPGESEQVFLGPFDDTPGDDIYSPLQRESQFCAACHSGSFWGVSIYDSFGEWLASPYSSAETGKTCQDCHMPPLGMTAFVQLPPDVTQYVPERDAATIFSHRMPGASDIPLLQSTAELAVDAQIEGDSLFVSVGVTNSGAGHDLPTDNPLRNVILLVEARDAGGQPLDLLEGAVIPDWGGVGNPASGHYAGLPGVLYAKILADFYTDETPTYAYWRQTRLVSDNRIPALATDTSRYRFGLRHGEILGTARLYLRRAFIDLMDVKDWQAPDILMEEAAVTVTP